MRGRDLERKLRPILNCLTWCASILPRRLRAFLFDALSGIPGLIGVALRYAVARSLLKHCGRNIYIGRFCTIKHWEKLSIGSNCSLHEYCYVDALGGIELGTDVSIAHNSSLVSFEHTFHDPAQPIRDQPLEPAPIKIDSDVWIGAGCRILSGVHLRSRTIVAAGAVVNRSIDRGAVLGGVPARVLKELPQ